MDYSAIGDKGMRQIVPNKLMPPLQVFNDKLLFIKGQFFRRNNIKGKY